MKLAHPLQTQHAGMESPAAAAAVVRSPAFGLAMLQRLGWSMQATGAR